jgi:hypothetical protein
VRLSAYLLEHRHLEPAEISAILDQRSRAVQRPWAARDYPHLAAWVKANEKPLAVLVEATHRPDYFNPLVSRREERGPGALMGALLPGVQSGRELAYALATRAMLRVGEGQLDAAWQDLLACHRLGRLVARGASPVEALVGIGIDHLAGTADLTYLEHAKLSARQAHERLKDLQGLAPLPPLADKIDLHERFLYLDSVQLIRRGGIGKLEGLAGGKAWKPDADERRALEKIDWAPALRNGNRWYDRLAAALRHQDRADREKALDRIEKDLQTLKENVLGTESLAKLLFQTDPPDKALGTVIGDFLIGLLMPAARKVQSAHDRFEQEQRNLRVAFALAAFRGDNGRYPAKLDELAARYLAAVPNDLFSGKALVYRPTEKGYLLYSVGVNGKDDGGRSAEDDPPGDDLSVRMPLPELKAKK